MHNYGRLMTVVTCVLAFAAAAAAQLGDAAPVAYVTVVTGDGATRGPSGPAFPDGMATFGDRNNGLRPGESVVTGENGAAVVWLPDYRIVIHLGSSTELAFAEVSGLNNDVPVSLTVVAGRMHVVRKPSDNAWLLIGAGTGEVIGYTLSKGASLVAEVDASGVTFTATRGRATFFRGAIPGGPLIGDDGQPIDKLGAALSEGQRASTRAPAAVQGDEDAPRLAWKRMNDDLYQFGVNQSSQWVEQAEKGDFTPVRSESTASARTFGAEVGVPRQTFDQPRTTVTSPAARTPVTAVRAARVNTAQALIGSQIPSSVVIGQRIRRSRIIGNPGTTGSGQIRFNPNAEQLLLLAGRSGRR